MDAPVKELARINALLEQARTALEDGRADATLDDARHVLALDPKNIKAYRLMGDAYEALGKPQDAERMRAQEKVIKRDAWQRQVEAEVREQHEMMGEAIRHERL